MEAGRLRAIPLIIVSFRAICPRIRKLLISEMSVLWTGVYSLLWIEVAILTVRHLLWMMNLTNEKSGKISFKII